MQSLTFTFASPGSDFYIRFRGWDGSVIDHRSNGSYSITVSNNGNDDYEPDDTFEDAREINSFPIDISRTVLSTAANDNNGDYEFFKVTINDQKKGIMVSITGDCKYRVAFQRLRFRYGLSGY